MRNSNHVSTDMTSGNMLRQIILFALPMLATEILQNLYSSVDAMVIGKFLGTSSYAAINACTDIINFLTGFLSGFAVGVGVIFARYFGEKNYGRLSDSIHTAMLFAILFGGVISILGMFGSKLLLILSQCPDDILSEAQLYLTIIMASRIIVAMYNVAISILRALGNSRLPLYYSTLAGLVNVVLDLLAVVVFRAGIAGTAIATVASEALSLFLAWRKLKSLDPQYALRSGKLKIEKKLLKEIVRLGFPFALQSSLTSFSNMFIQRYINGFGTDAIAGIGAAKRVDRFIIMIARSFGMTETTFISQNLGAKKVDRAFRAILISLAIATGLFAAVGIPIYIFASWFLRLFLNDPTPIAYGTDMIRILIPAYAFYTVYQIIDYAIRGFGRSRSSMLLSLSGLIVCRQIFLAISMSVQHSVTNIYYSYPVGWISAMVFVCLYYYFRIHREYFPSKQRSA